MFQIIDVAGGWFVIMISSETDAFSIECTKYAGIDIGAQLLGIANSLIENQPVRHYICLNSEQYVYRMELQQNGKSVKVLLCEITGSKDSSVTAFRFYDPSPSALDFSSAKPPVFAAEYDAFEVAKSIYVAFRDIDKAKYQQNWFPFPRAEYDRLHQFMKYRI